MITGRFIKHEGLTFKDMAEKIICCHQNVQSVIFSKEIFINQLLKKNHFYSVFYLIFEISTKINWVLSDHKNFEMSLRPYFLFQWISTLRPKILKSICHRYSKNQENLREKFETVSKILRLERGKADHLPSHWNKVPVPEKPKKRLLLLTVKNRTEFSLQ